MTIVESHHAYMLTLLLYKIVLTVDDSNFATKCAPHNSNLGIDMVLIGATFVFDDNKETKT